MHRNLTQKELKVTILSIKSQTALMFQGVTTFLIGFVMAISFQKGFLTIAIVLFLVLVFTLPKAKKYLK